MATAVQFGAGNIGRGFLGELFYRSGLETVFIEINEDLIKALNQARRYRIEIRDEAGNYPTRVENVRAVLASDEDAVAEEVARAEIAATAVGVAALPQVAPLIAKGLVRRFSSPGSEPLNIIICENLLHSADYMRKEINKHILEKLRPDINKRLGLSEAVVSRMVPLVTEEERRQSPLYIAAEKYARLPVDAKGFVGEIPEIYGLKPVDNITAFQEQKLFTHNLGHALTAYFGYEKGYVYIYQAVADEEIKKKVLAALAESGEALVKKHPITREEQEAHIADLLSRFANRALGDTIARVARDPVRKLGPNDRLIGAGKLALEYGIKPHNLIVGIIAALGYDNPQDVQAVRLQEMLRGKGLKIVLKEVSGLKEGDELFEMIVAAHH